MPWPSLTTVLLAWGILAPLASYGWTKADAYFDKRRAIHAARQVEFKRCQQDIEDIRRDINDAADKRVSDAMDAAGTVAAAPADTLALQRLCKSDGAACRSNQGAR